MPNWKKVVVSGSNAQLNQVTASYFKGDGSAITGVQADTANIAIKDEGSSLTSQVQSLDFVGSSLTATTVGNAVTVTATSASPFLATGSYYAANADLQVTGSLAVKGIISEEGVGLVTLNTMEKAVAVTSDGSSELTLANMQFVTTIAGEAILFE
tara:strand:- start:2413 stop:2877 length:465 start_codon:yes stop_codon:yes gene_type:complete